MLYCGMAVAKHKHAVSCMDEKGRVIKAVFTIANTRAEFDELHEELKALGGAITIGLETIGLYWLTELMGDLKRKSLTSLDCIFLEYDRLFSNVCLQSPRAVLQEAVSHQ